ncbi:potassium uptake protein, TrkH family [Marvinbryantia formatexigens DSM 14469]|uniref:Potassium uptake protein, TrkH family n=1 Tax=Marvinbryantia formatexigens DSM 14469 TaxID=478749 RepID=C6LC09_9FIRM|nr:potassium transporter TrkG [Marvinbryantia formatexigens]EET61962.1 potassium uptake protein, TrkH family [Marvinbryantia formatexigens DSM 14469]UWO25706.1 Trk family potassium uptake protein [Marvinbryantia formatexigens DSM 14469]SDF33488.1 trk system potassium uptake protein TrkH [Marvinbryantia formatexigens]
MNRILHKKRKLSSFQIIILGFSGVILLGTALLMLPVSSSRGEMTPFWEALFTSTSAVCVTGLVIHDTATYWSGFGQAVLLVLIQVGGMGVITIAALFSILSGRKISLMQRSTMQEAISAPKVGGIVRLTGFIIKTALLVECLGAAVLAPVFVRDFGIRGLWMALFHSVSAFCNAGFDLMGTVERFSSLTGYAAQPVVNLAVILLIITGGIGFLTWEDIRTRRWHLSKYRMQSKVILITTAVLILLPALYFYFFEFGHMGAGRRLLASLFQAVTPRTAGFNTADLTQMSEAGLSVIIVLMLIGGSPGSTAGGMKTTTVAVLIAASISTFSRKEDTHLFGRRVDQEVVKNAATILLMYAGLFFAGGLVISIAEGLPMLECLFESASAIGTVGLSLGLTPELGALSRGILILLMFFGRVGGLTLVFAAMSVTHTNVSKLPREKITVG